MTAPLTNPLCERCNGIKSDAPPTFVLSSDAYLERVCFVCAVEFYNLDLYLDHCATGPVMGRMSFSCIQ